MATVRGFMLLLLLLLVSLMVNGKLTDYIPPYEYDFIIDEDMALASLDYENVQNFREYPLTYMAYQRWGYLSLLQKIPYLIDRYFLLNLKNEFDILVDKPTNEVHPFKSFDFHQLKEHLQEYQIEKNMKDFFKTCDKNKDDLVEWIEYIFCRGYFDKQGNENDVSEFDLLDDGLRSDFAFRLANPKDKMVLYLIDKGVL
jgi:hypothetical protein